MALPSDSVSVTEPTTYRRELIRPTRFRRAKWRMETMAFSLFEFALGSLPLSWIAKFGRGLGVVTHRCLKRRRRTVRRNLRIAFAGEMSLAEIDKLVAEVFRRSGANLLCSLRTAKLSEDSLKRTVELRDEEVFREAIDRGRGVVMVLAHMGNWEALAQWFPRLLPAGIEGATVYRPLNNPIMNARVAGQRKRLGIKLFSKDDNPLGMASFLRRGGVLGVLSDQRAGSIGELVPFFGRLTSCTPIPAILARRTGATVVGISLRTIGAGRWELRFHRMSAVDETPNTGAVMGLVERMMRVSPADVFWLQDRWKVSSGRPEKQAGKVARGGGQEPAKRRRALLWLGANDRVAEGAATEPTDVDYESMAPSVGATWVMTHGESISGFLNRVDEGRPWPLDFVVGGGVSVRAACKRLGIAWTEGLE